MNDADVRAIAYDLTLRSGRIPSSSEIGEDAGDSLRRLAAARMLVLQPGSNEILMLPPFSAIPTGFTVTAKNVTYFANCIWDALGVPAMLRSDATITTSCGDCGAAMEIPVEDGRARGDGVLHFAVPARDWWNDIVFT
jgi:hypothetical protein